MAQMAVWASAAAATLLVLLMALQYAQRLDENDSSSAAFLLLPSQRFRAETVARALVRPLCLVLTFGEEVVLSGAPLEIARAHPNCLVRASSTQGQRSKLLDALTLAQKSASHANPGSPDEHANLFLDPIRLVSDAYNLRSAAPDHERLMVRMRTYLASTDLDQIAGAVVRAQTAEDVDAVALLLSATVSRPSREGSFVVLLQTCPGTSSNSSSIVAVNSTAAVRAVLRDFGLVFFGDFVDGMINGMAATTNQSASGVWRTMHWCRDGPLQEEVFLWTPPTHNLAQSAKPEPSKEEQSTPLLIGFTTWARFTNDLMELSALVAVARLLNRTAVVPDLGLDDCTAYLNWTQLNQVMGRPHQIVCEGQLPTLLRGFKSSAWTNLELDAPDPSTATPELLAEIVLGKAASLPKDAHYLVPGKFLFYGHFWGEGRSEKYWPRAWLEFSPTVYELADRVHEGYRLALSSLNGGRERAPALLGVHLRLTDYGTRSSIELWEQAMIAANLSFSSGRFDGLVICTDSTNRTIVERLQSLFPHLPFLGCIEGVVPTTVEQDLQPLPLAVLQTVLTRVSCFIGLFESSFAWRIQARRVLEGYASSCDQVVKKPRWR